MSRTPSNPRAPSREPQAPEEHQQTHERRVSTHSIPVSYAYGAPSVGKPPGRSGRPSLGGTAAGSPSVASMSARGGDAPSTSGSTQLGEEGEGASEEYTGRSSEPAAVRYARAKQRGKDTGQAFHSPATIAGGAPAGPTAAAVKKLPAIATLQGTSVQVATAFSQYFDSNESAKPPKGGPPPAQRPQERLEDEEDEEEQDGSGKETHIAGGAAGTPASKKRKKRTTIDPSFKHREGETSESEASELGEARSKAKRFRKSVSVDVNGLESGSAPPSATKKASTRRKPSDNAAYRPTGESAGSSEDDHSDDGTGHRRRRSKSKGKGRASSSQAIPIGRRDSEIWYGGKKRRGSKKGRKSIGEDGEEVEDEGDSRETIDGETVDMGGMDPLDQRQHEDDNGQEQEDDSTPAPPPTSFYLRPGTPDRSASTSRAGSHSPWAPGRYNLTPSIASASVDPAFGEFDRSIGFNSNGGSYSRSFREGSIDISIRSDHDYTEEERIVRAMEEEKRRHGSVGPVEGGGTGLRRRMPAPPQLGGIEEEDGTTKPASANAEDAEGVGSKLGKGVRPVLSGLSNAWRWTQNPLLDWGKILKTLGGLLALLWLISAIGSSSTPAPPPPTPSRSSWNPFRRSNPSAPFSPPAVPADSLSELVSRLSILESAMVDLSTLSTAERAQSSDDRQLLAAVQSQVAGLQSGLETERSKAKAVLEGQKEGQNEAKELDRTMKGVKDDLDALVARVRGISNDRQADVVELRRLQDGLQTVGKEIASLGTKVAQVAKDSQAGHDAERIARIALEAIEARLPSKLAVRMDNTGKLEIDPSFWKHLRDAFAGKQDVERLVRLEVAKLPKSDEASSSTQVVIKEPSWEEFLAANEVSLRTWVTSDLASRTGSDAIVSKKTFLDMLRRELKTLKQDFEAQANENVEKIGQEILSKVAKQEEMKRKDSLASHLNPFHRSPSPSTPQHVTIKSPDGQNISAIISTLVDSALLRYSKDVLAKPDYALYTAGARVIRSLTSPTYEAHPVGRGRRTLAWITGTGSPSGRPPVTALHPDNSPGSCWPFAGQQGQLGIYLSRRVVPSDITIEHVSVDVAIDGEVASAPREFEVWGVVEDSQDVRRLDEFRQQEQEAKRTARDAGSTSLEDDLEAALSTTSLPPTPNHLLLARGAYDSSLPSPIQTFPVTPMARQLAIPVNTVVLRILSNHGERAFTCLYRVRVSGTSEEVIRKAAAA